MKRKQGPGHGVHLRPRKVAVALAVVGGVVLSGCSAPGSNQPASNHQPTVLATFTVLADIARNIAGEHLRVESLTKQGAEIHEYEPTPSDVKKAQDADLILANGMGLEGWLSQFTASSKAQTVTLSQGVEPISIADGQAQGQQNPHAWMSPSNAEIYVDNTVRALTELDPQHAQDFETNATRYKRELREIQQELRGSLVDLPEGHKTLVTCEGAFSYLAQDAGLSEDYLWAVNSDAQVSARTTAEVIDRVREKRVPAVFCESTVNDSAMRQVVSDTGASFGGALYVDSLSDEGGDVPTYLDLLRYDVRLIAEGLTK